MSKMMVATTIETVDGWTRMVYHNTCVAKCDPVNRQFVLNTGGYKTVTTKKRINQFFDMFDIPYYITQRDFEWFVVYKGTNKEVDFVNNREYCY